ncbi:hypothetical protein [Methylobacter sp.]|uniref:hypothetical protein n=1 Tax=Methylobacter sp. TaxID=2051955 RepID=UPI0024894CF0|nr:hypothetical protein [Methylobacter sp.]MDI1279648.1 hypothetical protein [Methylobacter sp.]MDI1360317.1 hypothetical protein [Methylobacter sp.]
MSKQHWRLKAAKIVGLLFILGLGIRACVITEFSWKEEVFLHDGSKIIIKRENIYDANLRREIGQHALLAEQIIRFRVPTWKTNNRSDEQPESLNVLSLDFLDNIPYLATTTGDCLAYNKWGRPNPPYIFFKYVGEWQRISMEEFPEQFKINLLPGGITEQDKKKIVSDRKYYGFLRAETVAEMNKESGRSKQFYSIIRTPFPVDRMSIVGGCMKMIRIKNGWTSTDSFKAPLPIKNTTTQ